MAMHVYVTLATMLGLAAQNGAAGANVVAAGYELPAYITAAPGQVLTVLVQGISAPPSAISAGVGQWPAVLAGISATLAGATATGNRTVAVPIGSVFPFSNCELTAGSPCETLTGVTVQIPFEKWLVPQGLGAPFKAVLTFSDKGGDIATIMLLPTYDKVHILKSSDTIAGGPGGGYPVIVHADGTYVSLTSPAEPGETLVMYAVGLGNTNPPVATGAPSPLSPLSLAVSVAQQPFGLHYDFDPNASPSPGLPGMSTSPGPIFVGLSPGSIGLYQVNFIVTAPPSGTLPCGGPIGSNLTVTLVGFSSFDGAGICVDVSVP